MYVLKKTMKSSRIKNVLRYVIPSILSQVCFFLFTIIDGIFVGNGISTEALAAVNMAFPFIMVTSAAVSLISIGGGVTSAILIGGGDELEANQVFRHSMTMILVITAIVSFVGISLTDSICNMLGSNETYHQHIRDYIFWYSLFIMPNGLSVGMQAFCRNDNAPGFVSIAVIISTAINIILDWLLIFPLQWGTRGAAIATGVSQTISMLIVLYHYVRGKGIFTFGFPKFKESIIKDIFVNGLPAGIGMLSPAVKILCMNLVLISHLGNIGINAFSIISYVASFTVAIFNGASDGLQPLFGQSYGSKDTESLHFYFKSGMWINFIGSLVITGIAILAGRPICLLFGADGITLNFVLEVMPMYVWGFVVMALNVMIVAYLFSTNKSKQAIFINLLRGIVFTAVITFGVPAIFGGSSVWLTMGIYESLALVIAIYLLKNTMKK